ncbi:SRPBCC family protein [Streptomyces coeruleorubidus]|uniref:SRPBCC family protein n=1 Tax=Streptomyces coeruleorubidus TaxID=116188 RepID=A0A5J6HWH0_STRC4|nr:SRPBCC family protein [Streptomyces coeruleorubidus]QEV23482.1 SRPBCC family protein [Streptomyces coeruleorubidus]GGU09614.1 polyketide cyclase [Streptomyces coeruleorubidus]
MAHRLRPVGLDFVGTAPVRHVSEREISAPVEAVYRALEDVPGWVGWFPQVTAARPIDGGKGRDIRLMGGVRFRESVIAAEGPEVYAYRVDVTNVPGVRAIAEEWRLAPAGTGTRVRWTFATDGTAAYRLALRPVRAAQAKAFRDAVTALDRRLAAS